MKTWLLFETFLLTFFPCAALIYSIPFLLLGIVEIFFPMGMDVRSVYERAWGMFPYIGGMFAISLLWRYAFLVSTGKDFKIRWLFVVAIIGGGLASNEIFVLSNNLAGIVICLPPWILAMHLLYLRYKLIKLR